MKKFECIPLGLACIALGWLCIFKANEHGPYEFLFGPGGIFLILFGIWCAIDKSDNWPHV